MTTDLLTEWTDPDTAIEAVGNSLGVFEHAASPTKVLASDATLRGALYDVLIRLVDDGALDKRACGGDRYAFRWSASLGAVGREDAYVLVEAHTAPKAPAEPAAEPAPVAAAPAAATVPAVPAASARTGEPGLWARMAVQTAPLLLPAVSCVLALLAFLWLDQAAAFAITTVLAIVGVIGVVRRVQLAGFWMIGLIIAGVLVRFS